MDSGSDIAIPMLNNYQFLYLKFWLISNLVRRHSQCRWKDRSVLCNAFHFVHQVIISSVRKLHPPTNLGFQKTFHFACYFFNKPSSLEKTNSIKLQRIFKASQHGFEIQTVYRTIKGRGSSFLRSERGSTVMTS